MCCIDGGARVYRTIELLSGGSRELRSKGTRVWKAVELVDGKEFGNPVVLKDVWVDIARPQEGETTQKVRDTRCFDDQEGGNQGSFLTVVCHGDVFLDEKRAVLDCTRFFASKNGTLCARTPQHRTRSLPSKSKTPLSHCLVHYRVVFREVCSPLADEDSLPRIFGALTDITHGKPVLSNVSKYEG